jgi:hypothetical protein
MGYLLSSLENLPEDPTVKYYLFAIRQSWNSDLAERLEANFAHLAKAVDAEGVYAKGIDHEEWLEEVASTYLGKDWKDYEALLPALILSDSHPKHISDESLLLFITLKDVKDRFGDWDGLFREVTRFMNGKNNKFIDRFRSKGDFLDAIDTVFKVRPSIFGITIDVSALAKRVRDERKTLKHPRGY